MGLTLGTLQCINCKSYRFDYEDFEGNEARTDGSRGKIQIPGQCSVCGAEMALVIFENRRAPSRAIAYNHTINDEPCYDESCSLCGGNSKKSWWTDSDDGSSEGDSS